MDYKFNNQESLALHLLRSKKNTELELWRRRLTTMTLVFYCCHSTSGSPINRGRGNQVPVYEILGLPQLVFAVGWRLGTAILSLEFFLREVGEIVQPQGVRRCRLLHIVRVYIPQIILEDRKALIHFRHAFIRFLVLPHPRLEQVHKTLFRIQILRRITNDRIIQLNFLHSDPPHSINYCKQQH